MDRLVHSCARKKRSIQLSQRCAGENSSRTNRRMTICQRSSARPQEEGFAVHLDALVCRLLAGEMTLASGTKGPLTLHYGSLVEQARRSHSVIFNREAQALGETNSD